MEGTLLSGKYRLLQTIGVGGMGTVYEAEHVDIHRKVAIKLLHGEFAQNADAVARFRREAQIAGSLGHDNICDVLDVGVTDTGGHYLVMPLLRGASLAHILSESGAMTSSRALDVVAQVLGALSAAHLAGVVHRDLKPENVFITRVGDREDFVKVLDFGISKIVSTGGALPSSMTRTGTVMGTPYYMAPEQARGQKDQDHRVDVYAAGVMLYEMITARRPYDGDTFNELIIKIVTEPYPAPRTIRDGISPRVEAIVQRAMERDRDMRYPDAASMRAEVLAVRAGLGSDSIPGTRMVPTLRGDARTPPPSHTSQIRPQSPSATERHEPEPRSRRPVVIASAAAGLLLVCGAVGVFAFSGGGTGAEPATASPMTFSFPTTAAPAQTSLPQTAVATPLPETAVVGVDPDEAPPEVTETPERTGRRPRHSSASRTTAPATAAPATAAPERPRSTVNPRVIQGRSGTRIITTNE